MTTQEKVHHSQQAAVHAALQMWLTFEYISPQKPPAIALKQHNCSWSLPINCEGDSSMPWRDPNKVKQLNKLFSSRKRFMLFAGVIPGNELVETVRDALKAPALKLIEQRKPAHAAAVVIPLDEDGFVSGPVFVSSVPWALCKIVGAVSRHELFDFSGFFGREGVQAKIIKDVDLIMRERQLVVDDNDTELGAGMNRTPSRLRLRTLTAEDVKIVVDLVFKRCGWGPLAQADWVIHAQKAPEKVTGRRAEDPLNSFYAEDLENVQRQYRHGQYGKALSQYLEMRQHSCRFDVESTRDHLIAGVHPSKTPLAAWPGKYPLVTAQQFAVNTLRNDLARGGLFSVNGPPGTGKTTMLKDVLAAVVQERADALLSFDDPMSAFRENLAIENHPYRAYKPDLRIAGFGIIVTSANNGAVENISKELPSIAAVDPEVDIDYFADVADSIGLGDALKRPIQRERWGLVSAVLGNQANKSAFASDFWFGKKPFTKSLPPGQPPPPPDPQRRMGLQDWINSRSSSVPSWPLAKKRYLAAREAAEDAMATAADIASKLEQLYALNTELPKLQTQVKLWDAKYVQIEELRHSSQLNLNKAEEEWVRATAEHEAAVQLSQVQTEQQGAEHKLNAHLHIRPYPRSLENLKTEIEIAKQNLDGIRQDLQTHNDARPSFLADLFKTKTMRHWQKRSDALTEQIDKRREVLESKTTLSEAMRQWIDRAAKLAEEIDRLQQHLATAEKKLQSLRPGPSASIEELLVTKDLAARKRDLTKQTCMDIERDKTAAWTNLKAWEDLLTINTEDRINTEVDFKAAGLSKNDDAWKLRTVSRDKFHSVSPYHDDCKTLFSARRELFKAAMELHQSFIVAAWPKLKGSLSAFVNMMMGNIHPSQVNGGPMPLWDTFFLVVPLVSTTFASLPQLFRGIDKENLAWLLIDEAGQATPQQAVGAIWRAKRAVVVGDPLQLEPVVALPNELIDPVRVHCGANASYLAPKASAQTLADTPNQYGTYIDRQDTGKIWLGSPLVVHRRCINPMFDICNQIAYAGRMVYGTSKEEAAVNSPPSQWIDLPAMGAIENWAPNQGEYALKLIKHLAKSGLCDSEKKLRIYVVTPFRSVAENMCNLIAAEYGWVLANQMCGTVHTFQGKEADFVIFLLGGNPFTPAVISQYAGASPNLVNVAVSRAKKRLYVIGDRAYWTGGADVRHIYQNMSNALSA